MRSRRISFSPNLKKHCNDHRNDKTRLTEIISDYTNDLQDFANSFRNLIKEITTKPEYAYPFLYLEFGSQIYPLVVRLYMQNKLDKLLPILEKTELRVYNFNTSDPVADIYHLSSLVTANDYNVDTINEHLNKYIINKFMSDSALNLLLSESCYNNSGVKYLLLKYNNNLEGVQTLTREAYKDLEVEHIFSQNPNFVISAHGFRDNEHYESTKHKLGNLTLFEEDNSNDTPFNKSDKYMTSNVFMTQTLGSEIKKKGSFTIDDINNRIGEITDFCLTNL